MIKITRIILLALVFLGIFGLFSVEVRDPDFWWHLKTGDYLVQQRALPATDPFAYTSPAENPLNPDSVRMKFILAQYWLSQVLFSLIYQYSGFQGIIHFRAGLLALLVFLIYRSIRREGFGMYSALIFLIPVVLIFHTFTGERPQLFSFLFSFVLIFLLEGFRKSSSLPSPASTGPNESQRAPNRSQSLSASSLFHILPIPLIMLFWANMHGLFILGLVILAGYTIAEWIKYLSGRFGNILPAGALKLLTAIFGFSVLVSLANPNFYMIIPFLAEFAQHSASGMITEHRAPLTLLRSGFYEPQLVTFFLLVLLNIVVFIVYRKKLDLTDMVILSGLTILSLSASRFIPFSAPLSLLLISRYLSGAVNSFTIPETLKTLKSRVEVPLSIVLSITLVLVINNADIFQKGIKQNRYPEGAAHFLREHHIQGNMFNPYIWGGYLMWALYPDYKVFIDGRGLLEEVFFQEVRILEADPGTMVGLPRWKALLNAYKVNFIVTFSVGNFSGRLMPLIPGLLNDPEWHLVYMDNISLIFVRGRQENQEIIARFGIPKEWLWNEVAVEAALKAKDAANKGTFYLTMGDAFFAKKSYNQAKEAYTAAFAFDPGNSHAKQQLQILEGPRAP